MTIASKLMICGRCGGHATVPDELVFWTALGTGLEVVCPECLTVAENVAIADFDVVGMHARGFVDPLDDRESAPTSVNGEARPGPLH